MTSTLKFAPLSALCPAGALFPIEALETVLKSDIFCSGHLHIVLGREDGSSLAGHVVGECFVPIMNMIIMVKLSQVILMKITR